MSHFSIFCKVSSHASGVINLNSAGIWNHIMLVSAKDHNTKEMELFIIHDPLDQPGCQQMLLTLLQKIENPVHEQLLANVG
jgi:hypothetical protein